RPTGRPGGGRKKGALSRPGAPGAAPPGALRDIAPPGGASPPAPAAHQAPTRAPTPPPTEPARPILAPRAPDSAEPGPGGGHRPTWCIALAVRLVTAVKLSIRSVPRALAAVLDALTGRPTAAPMSATAVRCWLMRLGLWALLRPLPRADDWAYLIDHT